MNEGLRELLESDDAETIHQGVELALALDDGAEVIAALDVLEGRELPTYDWAKYELLGRGVDRWPELRARAGTITHAQWWGAPRDADIAVLLQLPSLRYVMVSRSARNLHRLAELPRLHTLELFGVVLEASMLEQLRAHPTLHSLFLNEVELKSLDPLRGASLGAFRFVARGQVDLSAVREIAVREELDLNVLGGSTAGLGELNTSKIALRYMAWESPVAMPRAVDVALDEVSGSLDGLAECLPVVERLLLDMCPDAQVIAGFETHPTLRTLEIRRMRAQVDVGPHVEVKRY